MKQLPLSQKKPDGLKGKFFRYTIRVHHYSGAPVIKTHLREACKKTAFVNLHVYKFDTVLVIWGRREKEGVCVLWSAL